MKDIQYKVKVDCTLDELIDLISDQFNISRFNIKGNSNLVNDLGLDSLDTVELIMVVEDKFRVHIPDEAAEKIETVLDLAEYIVKYEI